MIGEIDKTIVHYHNSLNINEKKPDCLYNLGNAYCIKEKFQEALESF